MMEVADEVIPLFYPVRLPEMELAALAVMRSGQIASGPLVDQFEAAFGQLVGQNHLVCTNDMTSALVLALKLAGVLPGDEVATLAFSCMSSNSAIKIAGANPVWIDLDPSSMTMSVDDLEAKLSPTIKAVTLYHVAGYPAPADKIAALCNARGIPLIEDCNAAVGASFGKQQLGEAARFAVYSFYPNRQVNALEGGALACPDIATAQRARQLRRYGVDLVTFRDHRGEINPSSEISEIGLSASFSQLHAAVALSQLPTLSNRIERTRENAECLADMLDDAKGVRVIKPLADAKPAYWVLLLDVDQRDDLLLKLKASGIQCSILHHRNDVYSGFGKANSVLPGTAHTMRHIIAIPCGWWLHAPQIHRIAATLQSLSVSTS